jgi:hypothetical protein
MSWDGVCFVIVWEIVLVQEFGDGDGEGFDSGGEERKIGEGEAMRSVREGGVCSVSRLPHWEIVSWSRSFGLIIKASQLR